MKKRFIAAGVIVGLGIAGTLGYLKWMTYLSNKAMDIVHQQIDKLNTNPQIHIEYVSESRVRFHSEAELLVTYKGYERPLHIQIDVYQGLTYSHISAYESSPHSSEETYPLHQWDKTWQGVSLGVRVKNWAFLSGDIKGGNAWLSFSRNASLQDLEATAHYEDDGRLVLSASLSHYAEKGANGQYKAVHSAGLAFRYDVKSSQRIVQAWSDFFNSGLANDSTALTDLLISTRPDVHFEAKGIQQQSSLRDPEFSADNLVIDITPHPDEGAPTHITGTLTGLGYSIYRRDISWDMALDASVEEALMKLVRRPEQVSSLMTALAQSSPRLAVKELRVTGENTEPMVASGEFQFEGKDISSLSDITFKRTSGSMTVTGALDLLANITGLRATALGSAANVELSAGHLYVNGQKTF